MTAKQQLAERMLLNAQAEWLTAYGWKYDAPTARWKHEHAPKARESYEQRDALAMTRAETLRYGGAR